VTQANSSSGQYLTSASIGAPATVARGAAPTGVRTDGPPAGIGAMLNRVMPHSPEAEACVLGSMIIDSNTIDIVVNIDKAEDFFRPSHQIIFQTLLQMRHEDKPIDLVTLPEELARAKLLERVGGIENLVALVDGVPSVASVEYYARVVRDKSLLRSLIAANQAIANEAFDSTDEPAQVLDRAEHTIFQLNSRQVGDSAASLESLLQQTFETLQNADGSLTGLATGYYKLDELMCGLQRGEMIVLAARPSMGKTALALNMAEYMAVEDKRPTLIFSLEMAKEQLAQRFLCSRAKFNSQRLRRGNIGPEDWTVLQMAAGDLEKAPIFIDDSAELNILTLRAKARRMKASHDIACVFVDYIQLMAPVTFSRNDSRQQQISEISRGLKALARDLKIPVVVLSQLNRGPEDRDGHRPRMSDLRESGAIEQDADVVMLLHREDYYHREPEYVPTHITELIIAKQRNGPTDTVNLTFLAESIRFENYASENQYGP
jgi:replicative DNA helicase